jgi:hypothetical protein
MVLLLARCWEYRLKTEDVLELTQVCVFYYIGPFSCLMFRVAVNVGKSQNCSLYGGWFARGWRNILDRAETAPETYAGSHGAVGARTGRPQVRGAFLAFLFVLADQIFCFADLLAIFSLTVADMKSHCCFKFADYFVDSHIQAPILILLLKKLLSTGAFLACL